MYDPTTRCGWRSAKAVVCCIGLGLCVAAQAQDSYLDMLDAYSDEVSNPNGTLDGDDQTVTRGTFEDQLRRNFKGSYVLYSKLPDESKQIAFDKYQETGRAADVRSLIVKLYANR